MADDGFGGFDRDPYRPPESMLDDAAAPIDDAYLPLDEHDYLAPTGRRNAALALLGVTIGFNALSVIITLVFWKPLERSYDAGDLVGSADALLAYGSVSVLTVLASMAYFTLFLTWLYRMYKNLFWFSAAGELPPRYTPGWSVGCWFVPIMNLFRPAQVMADVFLISDPGSTAEAPYTMSRLVQAWWAVWLISTVFANIAARLDDMRLLLASDLLDLLSRGLTFLVILGASRMQVAKRAAVENRPRAEPRLILDDA